MQTHTHTYRAHSTHSSPTAPPLFITVSQSKPLARPNTCRRLGQLPENPVSHHFTPLCLHPPSRTTTAPSLLVTISLPNLYETLLPSQRPGQASILSSGKMDSPLYLSLPSITSIITPLVVTLSQSIPLAEVYKLTKGKTSYPEPQRPGQLPDNQADTFYPTRSQVSILNIKDPWPD